jgi:hypothetical protein
MVVAAGVPGPQMMAVGQRLRGELDDAKVKYQDKMLKFIASVGVASAAGDPVSTIEDLMRLALQRLQRAGAATPTVPPAAAAAAAPRNALPQELERLLRYLEGVDIVRLGPAADEFARRLERIAKAIQAKRGGSN